MMSYGDIDMGQQWLSQWFAWRHQDITWTKLDLSSNVFCGFRLTAISQEVLMNLIRNMRSNIYAFKGVHIYQ